MRRLKTLEENESVLLDCRWSAVPLQWPPPHGKIRPDCHMAKTPGCQGSGPVLCLKLMKADPRSKADFVKDTHRKAGSWSHREHPSLDTGWGPSHPTEGNTIKLVHL